MARKCQQDISCKCQCKFEGRKCPSSQNWNNDKCQCECQNLRKHHVGEKDHICNPSTCTCENGKYFVSAIVDKVTKTSPANTVPAKNIKTKTVPAQNIKTKTFATKILQQKLSQQKIIQQKLLRQILTKKRQSVKYHICIFDVSFH